MRKISYPPQIKSPALRHTKKDALHLTLSPECWCCTLLLLLGAAMRKYRGACNSPASTTLVACEDVKERLGLAEVLFFCGLRWPQVHRAYIIPMPLSSLLANPGS